MTVGAVFVGDDVSEAHRAWDGAKLPVALLSAARLSDDMRVRDWSDCQFCKDG
jgi:hypothetical protein